MSGSESWAFAASWVPLLFLLVIPFFPPQSITWSRGPDLPLPRGGYYAAWHQGGLLVAGGTYWKDKKKYWTDRVDFYNPSLGRWSRWKPLPRPLAYGSMVEARGTLYLIGGSDEDHLYGTVYRLSGQDWTTAGEAPVKLIYTAAAAVGSRIYLFGGGSSVNDLTTATNESWVLDLKEGRWHQLAPVPGPPRVIHTVAHVGPYIYLFGGSSQRPGQELYNLDDAYRFDCGAGTWKALRRTPAPIRAWWATTAGRDVYLFGGYSDRFLDDVYRYDPSRDEYRIVSHLPVPLADTKFFYDHRTFYGTSGEDQGSSRFRGTLIGQVRD